MRTATSTVPPISLTVASTLAASTVYGVAILAGWAPAGLVGLFVGLLGVLTVESRLARQVTPIQPSNRRLDLATVPAARTRSPLAPAGFVSEPRR